VVSSLARVSLSYLVLSFVASLFLGIVRALLLFFQDLSNNQYIADNAVANASIGFGAALVLWPVLVACWGFSQGLRRAELTRVAYLSSLVAVFPAFLWLTTPIGFYQPVTADLLGATKEVLFWGGLLCVVTMAWRRLFSGQSFQRVMMLGATATFVLLAVLGALGWYSAMKNPSRAPQLDLEPSAGLHPNVFVVLVDTLRADHLSVYGYGEPTSPFVDKFASLATVYTNAISQASWTRPSCASLLTSLYPPDLQMREMDRPLPQDIPILSQFLKVDGYLTAGIVSSIQVSRIFGFDKGFDVLDIGRSRFNGAGLEPALARLRLKPREDTYPRYNAEDLTSQAIAWIESQRTRDRPLFMYLHYSDPHEPYRPPPDHDRWREFSGPRGRTLLEPPSRIPRDGATFSEAEVEALTARYDAEIAFFDEQFGRLMRHLMESDLFSNSLVILTSDHGEEFLDHGAWGHSTTLYKELLHVPLIVKYPVDLSVEEGQQVSRPVALVDVVPTVEDVLGADWRTEGARGQSLLRNDQLRTIYADTHEADPALRTLYSGTHKLIQSMDEQGRVVAENYYSLDSDFGEKAAGVLPTDPLLLIRLDAMRSVLTDIDTGTDTRQEVELPTEVLDELRALGYID